jgi:hypothetical protein
MRQVISVWLCFAERRAVDKRLAINEPKDTGLHHAMPVPQQLPQIAILPARHPDLWKAILDHQAQNQLGILAIRLLLAYSLGTDLSGVSDPQLKLQLTEQSFKPARMPAGFHPYTHLHSLGRQIAVELLRLLAVLQSLLPAFASVGIHKRNLLEARMVVTPYNPHVRLLSPGPWLVGTTKAYSGLRSRHCYGIIYTHRELAVAAPRRGFFIGASILFTAGAGSLSNGTITGSKVIAVTNSSGVASVTLTLPSTAKTVTVTAEAPYGLGHPVATFTETSQ